ncbi:MAG TPA: hypothetical protein VG122_05960 [Gemmata sp.]|nr:hypothetical protein [Gemmata sp.]
MREPPKWRYPLDTVRRPDYESPEVIDRERQSWRPDEIVRNGGNEPLVKVTNWVGVLFHGQEPQGTDGNSVLES